MNKDYYSILGVNKKASQEDIKKAFRTLSKEHHPDHGGDEEKFKEVNEAYSILSNTEKRADYDNPMRNMHFSFGDIFGGFGINQNRRRYNPNAPRQGRHLTVEREVPLRFFILGGKIKINLSFKDNCKDCQGTGAEKTMSCNVCGGKGMVVEGHRDQGVFIQTARPCGHCGGKGTKTAKPCESCSGQGNKEAKRELELDIPAGLRDGQAIGIAGQGAAGINGGPPGDLMVKLYMKYPKLEDLTEEQKKILKEM